MRNISSICTNDQIKNLCIGKFDGVHIAHQKLFSYLEDKIGAVLMIEMLKPPYLTPEKERWIPYPCYKIRLEEIQDKDCEGFALFLKNLFPNLQKIIVGYDFRFGKNRSHGPKDLEDFFDVCVMEEIRLEGVAVHRQSILQALQNGEISKANAMLGRIYSIQGEVIKGQGRGAKECVPTLNLEIGNYVLPKEGVYASFTTFKAQEYRSITFLGHRLSSDGRFALETHLLDASPAWGIGEIIQVSFVELIRENQRFDSLSLLKQQIQKDSLKAREILESV